MIVFDGELSIECKLKSARNNTRPLSFAYLIMFIVFCPACLILYKLDVSPEFTIDMFAISFLFLPLGLLMLFLPANGAAKRIQNHRIEFIGEQVVFINRIDEMNIVKQCWNTAQIKKIKDEGIYYEVSVQNRKLVCEKRF